MRMLYLKQGFDEKYPLGFLSPANCVMLQTTERSSDGSPRYCMNPNSTGTYWLKHLQEKSYWGSMEGYTPLNTEKELELALKISYGK